MGKLSIVDHVESLKMENLRGRSHNSPLSLPIVVPPQLPSTLEKQSLKYFRVFVRMWQDNLNAEKRKFVTRIKSRVASTSIVLHNAKASQISVNHEVDWISGERVVIACKRRKEEEKKSDEDDDDEEKKVTYSQDEESGLCWYEYDIQNVRGKFLTLSPDLTKACPPN